MSEDEGRLPSHETTGEPEGDGVPDPKPDPAEETATETPTPAPIHTEAQADTEREAETEAESETATPAPPVTLTPPTPPQNGFPRAHRTGAGPFDPRRWKSPIRGPWLTSVFGAVLLVGIPIEFITGIISYAAYNPRLPGNDTTPNHGILGFYLFNWITSPSWIYRVSQGTHILLGLALVPVVAAKLWSVIPKLFAWPPLRSIAQALERISLLALVGGIVFELATGIMNIDYDYSFKFSFYNGHLYGAWVFIAGFSVHVALKLGRMWRSLRSRRFGKELRTGLADTHSEPVDDSDLVAVAPAPATVSRRGALALVGASSLAIIGLTAGESIGGKARSIALLAPRGRSYGSGPNAFQVNRTAVASGVTEAAMDPAWQVEIVGANTLAFTRAELLGLFPQEEHYLPIACVEGWSTTQHWSGIRLSALATLVGIDHPGGAHVESLQTGGAFNQASLSGDQVSAGLSLLALKVNGADLSLDHGFPARIIVPALPGVHNTKWVSRITFTEQR